jgi:hypothetical protein
MDARRDSRMCGRCGSDDGDKIRIGDSILEGAAWRVTLAMSFSDAVSRKGGIVTPVGQWPGGDVLWERDSVADVAAGGVLIVER